MLNYTLSLLRSTYVIFGFLYNPPFNHDKTSALDVGFVLHSMLLLGAQMVLVLYYPRTLNRFNRLWGGFEAFLILSVFIAALILRDSASVVQFMAILTAAIAYIKNIPQIKLIHDRKSTRGFSFKAVYLDIGAQICSFFELIVTRMSQSHGSDTFGRILAAMSYVGMIVLIGYDIAFLLQQYIYGIQKSGEDDVSLNTSDDSLVKSSKRLVEEDKKLKEAIDFDHDIDN